jgi:hypothetical protein
MATCGLIPSPRPSRRDAGGASIVLKASQMSGIFQVGYRAKSTTSAPSGLDAFHEGRIVQDF